MTKWFTVMISLTALIGCGMGSHSPSEDQVSPTQTVNVPTPPVNNVNPLPPDTKYLCTAHFNFTALIPKWDPSNQKVYVVTDTSSNHYNYDDGDCPILAPPTDFAFVMTYIHYAVPVGYPSAFAGKLLQSFMIKNIPLYGTFYADGQEKISFQSLAYHPPAALTSDCLAVVTQHSGNFSAYDPNDPTIAGLVPPPGDVQVFHFSGDVVVGSLDLSPDADFNQVCGTWL